MTYKWPNLQKQRKIVNRRYYWLRKYKQSQGCCECGYNANSIALCFAHKNPMDKDPELLGRINGGFAPLIRRVYTTAKNSHKTTDVIKKIFNEIRKCKVMCVNCHTIETIEEQKKVSGKEISKIRNEKNMYIRKYGLKIDKQSSQPAAANLDRFF